MQRQLASCLEKMSWVSCYMYYLTESTKKESLLMAELNIRKDELRRWFRRTSITATGVVAMLLVAGLDSLYAQTWSLSWSDEFNASSGTAPSSSNWNFVTGGKQPNGRIGRYLSPSPHSLASPPKNNKHY